MLVLSKRLHSIFLLRLFNDCFVVLALFLTIYCFQLRQWKLGSQIFSFGVGVKMSLVLALPAAGVILLQAVGLAVAMNLVLLMGKLQVRLPPSLPPFPPTSLPRY
jgi:alpha-1,3-mannosyltransferase